MDFNANGLNTYQTGYENAEAYYHDHGAYKLVLMEETLNEVQPELKFYNEGFGDFVVALDL